MAEDLTQKYKFDASELLNGLQAGIDKLGLFEKAVDESQAKTKQSYADIAAAATRYSDSLAKQVAEQRQAQTVLRELSGVIGELTAQERELKKARKESTNVVEQQRLRNELDKNRRAQEQVRVEIALTRKAIDEERAAVERVREARRQEVNATKLATAASKDAAAAAKAQAQSAKTQASATEGAGKSASGLVGIFQRGLAAGAAFFALDRINAFREKIVEAGEDLGRIRARLTTAFGGDRGAANSQISLLDSFANEAGVDAVKLEESYANLVNRGIRPTKEQLRQLSDIAATSGKTIDQFAEAVVDSVAGQNERLAEFGITAKQSGDKVAFTYRGVTTEVAKTKEAITGYLFSLGDLEGVQGTAAALAAEAAGENAKLANSFTELFRVLSEKAGPAFSVFTKGLRSATEQLTASLKSSDQQAVDLAAKESDRFATEAEKRFALVAERAKASGKDASQALSFAYGQASVNIQKQLSEATIRLEQLNQGRQSRSAFDYVANAREGATVGRGSAEAAKQQAIGIKTQIELLKQQDRANEAAFKKNQAALQAEATTLGVIAALREKIKNEQEDLNNLKAGPDFEASRKALVAQIAADEKELDRLLGKVEKRTKQTADKLGAALRALAQERATLTNLAEQAQIKATDEQRVRAEQQFQADLRQIEVIKQKLIEREQAVRKAGGRGANADGVVDGVQQEQLFQLQAAATDRYYSTLRQLAQEHADKLFALQADSREKEREAIERNYEKQARDAQGQADLLVAIEAAKQRDLLAQRFKEASEDATQGRDLATSIVTTTVGENYGAGTGVSVIEAKRAEREALLKIEQEFLQKSLNNTLLLTGKEAELQRASIAARLAQVKNGLNAVDAEKKRHKVEDFFYKLVLGENDSDENRQLLDQAFSQFKGQLDNLYQAELANAQARVELRTRNISELQNELQTQIALSKAGVANDIQATRDKLNVEKAARAEAIEDQKKAAKARLLLETVLQVSSLASASATIFEVTAPLNVIPGLGTGIAIGLIGTMIGAFVASKLKALQAINNGGTNTSGAGFFTGGPTGGASIHEERGVVHGKEFVMPHEPTAKYGDPLLMPLWKGRPEDIDWTHPHLRALLPDYSVPGKMQAEAAKLVVLQQQQSWGPLEAKMAGMQTELAAIKQHVATTAGRPDVMALRPGQLLYRFPNGSEQLVNYPLTFRPA
ncbi:hypothetical protein LJ737_20715 [Hymenobacter sp. 15J16-1T3B]|uniref:hypothetical protein n=1 Tax=Hymenobacter sp. 15J16-1T3B TaxID=2886941 RepID=UPI001D11B9EA|nr:hypothetical protein [Hymenobacter sp. 15J16-1T3B]MCC3159676.1 hypothetical protein [Hymenobacter sp. 15J16-1T3B]